MNKITKYITTGASALLMLMSVGAVQNNVNASRKHARVHVTRYAKMNYRRNRNARRRNSRKANQKRITAKQFKQSGVTKHNKKALKRVPRRKRTRKVLKRNQRHIRKHVNQLRHRRYNSKKVLKPRYRLTNGNRSGNRALRKSGFVDGKILTQMGYSPDFNDLIFNKYAPNDKRARIPMYMNPRVPKLYRKIASYHSINNCFWVQGRFDLSHPQNNTKNPKVYKYYPKLHGWKLAPKNLK